MIRWLRVSLAVLLAACSGLACARSSETPRVEAGALDLSRWSFERQGIVALEGEWEICWDALVDPGTGACPAGWEPFPVPRMWTDSGVDSPIGGRGVASYRARIALPRDAPRLTLRVGAPLTAYRLWLDGEARGGVGEVSTRPDTGVARLANRQFDLRVGATELDVLVHVSNWAFRGGGLRRTWYLGGADQITARNGYELLLYSAFASTSTVIGLVFLTQFAFRRSERARGWFGLFAVLVGLRVIPGGTSDLYQLLGGWASFGQLLRLEYANTAFVMFAGGGYLLTKVPEVLPPRLIRLLQYVALALVPIHLFAPLDMVLATLPVILALAPLGIGLAIVGYGRATWRGVSEARSTLVASLVFAIGILHDVFRTQTGVGAPIELFPYFVVVWIAAEAQSLIQSFARTFARAEQLSDELQESNFELQETEEAVVRFVPFDLLRMLGKESIRDVRAGDNVDVELTVLSGFLAAPPGESAKGSFARVSELIDRVEGAIRGRDGFLSEQLGDRIVALFPGEVDHAIEAADEIQQAAARLGFAGVRIGIATGPVVLGTVGDGEHLSGIAVGPAVSLARQLRDLALRLQTKPLLAASAKGRMREPGRHTLRELGAGDAEGSLEGPIFEVSASRAESGR